MAVRDTPEERLAQSAATAFSVRPGLAPFVDQQPDYRKRTYRIYPPGAEGPLSSETDYNDNGQPTAGDSFHG